MKKTQEKNLVQIKLAHKFYGVSLIELMVSMAISLILLLAITNVYVGSKETYRVREDFSMLQELGRQALETLTSSIIMTDHWGGVPESDVTVGTVSITAGSGACNAAWVTNVVQPLIGEDGAGAVSGLTQFQNCVTTSEYVPNSDVLILRYADGTAVTDATADSTTGLFIRSEVETRGVVFSGGSSGAATGTGVGTAATLDATRNYAYHVEAYFLRNCSDTPCADGIPSLARLTMNGSTLSTEVLADGVEQIQYQYGIDTDADAVADQFMNAGAIANWNQVVAVRIDMIIRTPSQDFSISDTTPRTLAGGPAAGGITFTPGSAVQAFHRKQLTKIIQVRNRVRG